MDFGWCVYNGKMYVYDDDLFTSFVISLLNVFNLTSAGNNVLHLCFLGVGLVLNLTYFPFFFWFCRYCKDTKLYKFK